MKGCEKKERRKRERGKGSKDIVEERVAESMKYERGFGVHKDSGYPQPTPAKGLLLCDHGNTTVQRKNGMKIGER